LRRFVRSRLGGYGEAEGFCWGGGDGLLNRLPGVAVAVAEYACAYTRDANYLI